VNLFHRLANVRLGRLTLHPIPGVTIQAQGSRASRSLTQWMRTVLVGCGSRWWQWAPYRVRCFRPRACSCRSGHSLLSARWPPMLWTPASQWVRATTARHYTILSDLTHHISAPRLHVYRPVCKLPRLPRRVAAHVCHRRGDYLALRGRMVYTGS
jgi:hypothetical protein